MYPFRRLTWEEEVLLSDDLHAAKEVRKRLKRDGGQTASASDLALLAKGTEAADTLVLAHSGLVARAASEVLFGSETSGAMDFDDLMQIGMIALYSCTNSYDARRRVDGIDRNTGNRFSVYSRLFIRREMRRALKRGDATLSGSVATADRTNEWMRSKDDLEAHLGRRVTNAEVSDFSGITLGSIDITLLGRRPVIGQHVNSGSGADSEPEFDVGENERTGEVDDALTADEYFLALDSLLRTVLEPGEADAFSLWLGLDRETPRAMSEVAKELEIKMSEASELVGFAVARLRHPQNVAIVSALASKALASIIEGGVPVR